MDIKIKTERKIDIMNKLIKSITLKFSSILGAVILLFALASAGTMSTGGLYQLETPKLLLKKKQQMQSFKEELKEWPYSLPQIVLRLIKTNVVEI